MERNSEVARLLESIRLSYEAAHLALHGSAILGQHEFITRKMENMQQDHEKLQMMIGPQEAIKLMAETLDIRGEVKKSQEQAQ